MDTPPNFDTPGLPDPQPGPFSEPLPEPQAEPAKPRPAWMGWAAAVGAIVLVAGGFFGAKALAGTSSSNTAGATATGGAANGNANGNGSGRLGIGRRFGTGGTIASINGNTLTVTNPESNTTTKVVTSSTTRVTVAKTVTVGDVATGDRVVVVGTKSGTTVTATRINDMGSANAVVPNPNRAPGGPGGVNVPPGDDGGRRGFGPPGGGFTAGTVTSVASGTIVVKAADGTTTTVKTSASTAVTKNVASSVSALKVGDAVRAVGATASDGTVTATSITQGEGGFGFGGRRDGGPAAGGTSP